MAAEPVRIGPEPGRALEPSPVMRVLARARARAAVAKAAVLFILPAPLVFAMVGAMIGEDTSRLALSAGGLASVWGAGVLAWRGLADEARYLLGDTLDLPRVPRKMLSAGLTTVGAGLCAAAGGHTLAGASVFAVVGGVGPLCFYGRDLKPVRLTVAVVDGIDVSSVTEQLEQAERRLRRIEAASRAIAVPEFSERLARITTIGRGILAKIARDPRDASRARRFLHLYLDSTERVTEEYARTHSAGNAALEDNFRQLLTEMEKTFAEQHRRLLESDAVSLDVEIEVLNARLKREGMGEPVERGL
jgi:5-bromo-4-chloroindolyl phosphate hydrolysis protein